MISAIIHLGNRDWASLIDDFVSLNFLPANCNRNQIIPVCGTTCAHAEGDCVAWSVHYSSGCETRRCCGGRSWRKCYRRTCAEAALAP
jgi:hypothetical protein